MTYKVSEAGAARKSIGNCRTWAVPDVAGISFEVGYSRCKKSHPLTVRDGSPIYGLPPLPPPPAHFLQPAPRADGRVLLARRRPPVASSRARSHTREPETGEPRVERRHAVVQGCRLLRVARQGLQDSSQDGVGDFAGAYPNASPRAADA
jgi:hypothetical protein